MFFQIILYEKDNVPEQIKKDRKNNLLRFIKTENGQKIILEILISNTRTIPKKLRKRL